MTFSADERLYGAIGRLEQKYVAVWQKLRELMIDAVLRKSNDLAQQYNRQKNNLVRAYSWMQEELQSHISRTAPRELNDCVLIGGFEKTVCGAMCVSEEAAREELRSYQNPALLYFFKFELTDKGVVDKSDVRVTNMPASDDPRAETKLVPLEEMVRLAKARLELI